MRTKPQNQPSLRDRLKEATGQEILAAAEALLAAHGYAAVSMAKVAQKAGVSVGTLYNYYKDKDELFNTLLGTRRDEFHAQLTAAMKAQSAAPFADRLDAVVRSVLGIYDRHRAFLRIVLEGDAPDAGVPANKQERKRHPYWGFVEVLKPLTTKGVKDGELEARGAKLYPGFLAGLMRAAMFEGLKDDKGSFEDAAETVTNFFLRGARRAK